MNTKKIEFDYYAEYDKMHKMMMFKEVRPIKNLHWLRNIGMLWQMKID